MTEASVKDQKSGLVGYVRCRVNNMFEVDGMTLRRKEDGEYTLSFPRKSGYSSDPHFFFRPLNKDVEETFLRQVLVALGFKR